MVTNSSRSGRSQKKTSRQVEIEDVQEQFCGQRRKKKLLVPFRDTHPEIAFEWCYAKNAGWGPEDFSRGSGVRAWWTCPKCKRNYKTAISNRARNKRPSSCPFCANKKVCSDNALSVLFPQITAEWHPTKNQRLKVADVQFGSHIHAWWSCKICAHAYKMQIAQRTKTGRGCPACLDEAMRESENYSARDETGRVVLNENSKKENRLFYDIWKRDYIRLSTSHPHIAKQWHPTKNGPFKAPDFSAHSAVVAWWKCKKGKDHEWQTVIASRTDSLETGCPFCSNRLISATNSLAVNCPDLAKEWHPTRNGKLKPTDVVPGSGKRVWWQCQKDKRHQWQALVVSRSKNNKTGCPDCGRKRISDVNRLSKCFPKIAVQLHPTKNGSLKASQITVASTRSVWWKCPKGPDHEWTSTTWNRTSKDAGCPACGGRQVSVTNSLATLFPLIAKEWDRKKNGVLHPSHVHRGSKKSVWWICQHGHSWNQQIGSRTRSEAPCPECRVIKRTV